MKWDAAMTKWRAKHNVDADSQKFVDPGFVEWLMGFEAGWTDVEKPLPRVEPKNIADAAEKLTGISLFTGSGTLTKAMVM